MQNKEQIRNRIAQRRGKNPIEDKKSNYKSILVFLILMLTLYYYGNTIELTTSSNNALGYLKSYANGVNNIIGVMTKEISKLPLAKYLPFDVELENNDHQAVSSNSYYLSTENIGYYTNDTKQIYCIDKGIVVYVNDDYENRYIIVSQDNGVSVTYSNINIINVDLYDRLEKGMVMGSFSETIKLECLKNGVSISYESVIGEN